MNEFLEKLFAAAGVRADTDTEKKDALKKMLLALLDIPDGDTLTDDEAIDELKGHWARMAVYDGVTKGKLAPSEKDWAFDMIAENGLAVFDAFIAHRSKATPLFLKYGGPENEAAGIDEVQAAINKQLGVSPETFKKYAGRRSAT